MLGPLFLRVLLWIPFCQPFGWLQLNLLCIWVCLDHFHDLEVAVLPPLIDVLLQYVCSTLLSFHISPLTGVVGLAPVCLVDSLFCYSFCNILDILHVWCFPSRFPYCPCILSWCGSSFLYLLTTFGHWFVYFRTVGHISIYDTIDGLKPMRSLYFRIHPRSSSDLALTCH